MLVVKIGGSRGLDYDKITADVREVWSSDPRFILVHGGSSQTNDVAEKLGHPPEFVTSAKGFTSRRTDRRTLEIFEMVYCGSMNKGIVEKLQQLGAPALGLSGIDGRLWEGPRKAAIKIVKNGKRMVLRDDYTGRVEKVNTALLESLLESGFLPVLTPPAISYDGEAINVDGDRAAAITASAMGSKTFVILSNVPGLLENFPDESSLIREIAAKDIESFLDVAQDRMKKKVLGAQEALAQGVERVIFADGRVDDPIRRALDGEGTVIGG